MCDGLQGQLSVGKTWRFLRHLIDPTGSKTATNRTLTKVLSSYDGDGRKLLKALADKYIQSEKGKYPIPERYEGPDNEDLDRPFTITELWMSINESNKKSAPSMDAITHKLLPNMSGTVAR